MAANYMHKIESKHVWKEEMSYVGDTWYCILKVACRVLVPQIWWSCFMGHLLHVFDSVLNFLLRSAQYIDIGINL